MGVILKDLDQEEDLSHRHFNFIKVEVVMLLVIIMVMVHHHHLISLFLLITQLVFPLSFFIFSFSYLSFIKPFWLRISITPSLFEYSGTLGILRTF
jgi:hypothetical protein